MKRKRYSTIAKKFAGSLAILGVAMSGNAFANQIPQQTSDSNKQPAPVVRKEHLKIYSKVHKTDQGWDLGKGWLLTSTGGLSYIHPEDDSYWFKLSGLFRIDETIFIGSYRDTQGFPNGANVRTADVYLDGGVGKDWEYTLSLEFADRHHYIGNTHLAYSGLMENNQVFVGRVPGNWFCLDNSNSGTWNPFLERSLPALTFYPGDGLGVMTDFWGDMWGFTITAMQPDQGSSHVINTKRDRWKGTARATIAPVHEEGNVWHFGVSGAYRELVSSVNGLASPNTVAVPNQNQNGVEFSTRPSARTRNTAALVNTKTGNGNLNIRANNVRLFNVEMARQYGSFMVEGEYTNAFVHRIGSALGSLRFDGWNIQSRYLLTGESHEYDVRDGQFGSIKPINSYGAIEIAARYDFVGLNDKDVRGGSEHNATLGLNWFINEQVRLSANYVHASIYPANNAPRRTLNILGMRAQVRFK